jgi:hypothetical protein
MSEELELRAAYLRRMARAGVWADPSGASDGCFIRLFTNDPAVAAEFYFRKCMSHADESPRRKSMPNVETQTATRFETIWRDKWLTSEATTIPEMAQALREASELLLCMHHAGVQLEDSGMGDGYAFLFTYVPKAAEEFGLEKCPEDDEESPGTDGEE